MSNQIVIIINGKDVLVAPGAPLSYRDVAILAGFPWPAIPSMTMKEAGSEGRIVSPGHVIVPRAGMVFNVYDTSNA